LILVLSFSYICTDISFQQYNKQLSQQYLVALSLHLYKVHLFPVKTELTHFIEKYKEQYTGVKNKLYKIYVFCGIY
ncbi:hypothetical protein, partial [Priestia megaterium]|uniref:hypothetical protein n=1 Tax=Priestia megaterium TaxID=1404 RepID=UPI002FFDD6E7